jgi:hypothetical protein
MKEQFIEYLRNEENLSDTEIALMLFCIEDEYGSVEDALDEHGSFSDLSDLYYPSEKYDNLYECDEMEFYVFDDYDDAETAARDDVERFIEDEGAKYINGYEDYIDDDAEEFWDAMNESNRSYCEGIEDEYDDEYGTRLVRECWEANIISDSDIYTDADGEVKCSVDTDDLIELLTSEMNNGWDHPGDWMRDNFGEEEYIKFAERHDLFDVQELADYVVRSDGAANTLAGYDGKERQYEFDGTDYFIYRAN